MYYKLKTSFLEETLSEALDEDSFDLSLLDSSQTDTRLSSSFSECLTPDVSTLTSENSIIFQNGSNSINSKEHHDSHRQEFEAEAINSVNENAWLSTTKPKLINDNTNNKMRKSMSDKLFRNSSFLKRNPRKSLSRNSLTGSQSSQSSLGSNRKESLPDLETILSQKSKQQLENEESEEQQPIPLDVKLTSNLAINLDEEWLNRCTKANSIGDDATVVPSETTENRSKTLDGPKRFGISNINITALATLEQNQIVAEVQPKTMLSFDMNNLNLRSQNSITENLSTVPSQTDVDDDEIANSEDEGDMDSSRLIRSIRHSIKRKHNEIETPAQSTVRNVKHTSESNTNNNSKDANKTKPLTEVTLRKSKSNNKLQSKVRQQQKSESSKFPNLDDQSCKPSDDNNKVCIVARKSSRNMNKTKTYTEETISGNKSGEDAEDSDPFAGDDSDNDPNFSISDDPNLKRKLLNIKENSSSDASDDDDDEQIKPKTNKEIPKAINTKKRVSRIKDAVKPRIKTERKAIVSVKRKSSNKSNVSGNGNSDISENEMPQESPDDYLLEFGMETIKSVPRIPVTELEQNTKEFTKYVYNATSTDTNSKPTTTTKPKPLATKNAVARDKLEHKIAAGTLNENYVRLNLRKKVFVRGKKTMNFSRYKKKLWKSKKAAALSGPDMDMRGCDGGILTCFQCGLPGHFAQNCKAKSKFQIHFITPENNNLIA